MSVGDSSATGYTATHMHRPICSVSSTLHLHEGQVKAARQALFYYILFSSLFAFTMLYVILFTYFIIIVMYIRPHEVSLYFELVIYF